MMNYQIVATLGPSSATPAIWKEMLSAGVTALRLNTSHLSLVELHNWLDDLAAFLAPLDAPISVVIDLQGSKWRLGEFPTHTLEAGQWLRLIAAEASQELNELPVPHPDFFQAARGSSGEIVLNDARVRLALERDLGEALEARVVQGGPISACKGITYTASQHRLEHLSAKDQAIFEWTHGVGFVRYAISYVKDAQEMIRYRAIFGETVYLIAKLEREPALVQAGEIARCVNEIWLCRGDLGAELGLRAMAEAIARFNDKIQKLPAPALLAGQVLEHMTMNPAPTRSEVSYVYEALLKGYSGMVLSDETAVGNYPVESCRAAALFRA